MSEARWSIPSNWVWTLMNEISNIVGGGTPPSNDSSNFKDNGIPWLTPADLTNYKEVFISNGNRYLSNKGYDVSSACLLPAGTVLFSSRAPIGYCVIASCNISTSQGFKNFILFDKIVPEYIRYYLLSSMEYIRSKASGTTFLELSGRRAAALSVPVAPLPEQQRIVAKINGLTDKSRCARSHLDRISFLVKKYKEAVLSAAFSGHLTDKWRKIRGLPVSCGVRLGDVVERFSYGSSAKSLPEGRVPVLRMGNIQDGELDWEKLVFTDDPIEIKKYRLKKGDVLFNRTNSPLLVGKTACFDGGREAIYAGYIIRIQCKEELFPEFLSYCLNSPYGRAYSWRVKTGSVNQANINAKKLAEFYFKLPSVEEQKEIVRRIKSSFAWIDHIVVTTTSVSKLVEQLDQAVLSKAFRGELVPQDPNDEPASILLERIRAERAASPQPKRGRRKKA